MLNDARKLRESFLLNYFDWAISDAEREITQSFPLLKDIKGVGASAYIDYLSSIERGDKIQTARLLVKRSNPEALALRGETLLDPERNQVENFLNYYMARIATHLSATSFSRHGAETNQSKIDVSRLSKIIKQELVNTCGDVDRNTRRNEWTHRLKLHEWTILTSVALKAPALNFGTTIVFCMTGKISALT